MQAAAGEQGKRLLTFTIETELGFAAPADVHLFTDELATAMAELAQRFTTTGGRRYRVIIGGHPTAARAADEDLDASEPVETERKPLR